MGRPRKLASESLQKYTLKKNSDSISLYALCKEIFEEIKGPLTTNDSRLQNFRKDQTKKFGELIEGADAKNFFFDASAERYSIPITQKEEVKFLLKNYSCSFIKKVRLKSKNSSVEITSKDVEEFINLLSAHFNDENSNDIVNEVIRYFTFKHYQTSEEVMHKHLQNILNDAIQFLKPNEGTSLIKAKEDFSWQFRQDEIPYLFKIYLQMIQETTKQWKTLVEYTQSSRLGELEEISLTDNPFDEELEFKPISFHIDQALSFLHDDVSNSFKKVVDPEKMNLVKELLDKTNLAKLKR
ncbi:hypothetical protein [Paenibacillus sp. FSL R10-2736]|uniref:hypothetical protein n=1 Tax=Paenibacillus sp. FSL R10-2736 TaxID=2954692 RepID=UPI0030F988E2